MGRFAGWLVVESKADAVDVFGAAAALRVPVDADVGRVLGLETNIYKVITEVSMVRSQFSKTCSLIVSEVAMGS